MKTAVLLLLGLTITVALAKSVDQVKRGMDMGQLMQELISTIQALEECRDSLMEAMGGDKRSIGKGLPNMQNPKAVLEAELQQMKALLDECETALEELDETIVSKRSSVSAASAESAASVGSTGSAGSASESAEETTPLGI